MDATAANAAVPNTVFQSTAVIMAAAGISATAVCANVLTARIAAAFNHFFVFTLKILFLIFIHSPGSSFFDIPRISSIRTHADFSDSSTFVSLLDISFMSDLTPFCSDLISRVSD